MAISQEEITEKKFTEEGKWIHGTFRVAKVGKIFDKMAGKFPGKLRLAHRHDPAAVAVHILRAIPGDEVGVRPHEARDEIVIGFEKNIVIRYGGHIALSENPVAAGEVFSACAADFFGQTITGK